MFHTLLLPALLSIATAPPPVILHPAHMKVLGEWLQSHPGFRIASEADCGDCKAQIQSIRRGMGGAWKPVPQYEPYYVVGDLNGDGQKDFAVAVIGPGQSSKRFRILVYNGPFVGSASHNPAFVSEPLDLNGQGLFFGQPRPKPYRLLVGGFESEGILLIPKGKGYVWDQSSND